MGQLLIVSGVGEKKQEFDTVSCRHCQGLIKVILRGVTKAKETKYRCTRCCAPICKHCAEVLKGECSPILAKIEHALKTGEWKADHKHEYKILPHR